MKDKLSIPKLVSFAPYRMARIAKDATETNFQFISKGMNIIMKKRMTIIFSSVVILCSVMLFLFGRGLLKDKNTNSLANDNSTNSNQQSQNEVDSIYNSPVWFLNIVRSYEKPSKLNDEQIEQLEELKKIEFAGSHSRARYIIKGLIEKDTPRIDLKTAKEISSGLLTLPTGIPDDYTGGSGLSRSEIWLDDDGNKMLVSLFDNHYKINNYILSTSYNISRLSGFYNSKIELTEDEQKDLNEQQIKQLKAIRQEGSLYAGIYSRQEAFIKGLIANGSTRLDVSTVKDIISNSNSFDEILTKINEVVPYPDFIGGSGNSRIEYKIKDSSYDKIVILTQYEEIVLFQNSSPSVLTLYESTKEIETKDIHNNLSCELQEYETKDLSEEQIKSLKAVRENGYKSIGIFYNKEAIIKGLIDDNTRRLDVATAKEIIASSSSFKEAIEKIFEVQFYPYFAGIGGFTKLEYWLDDNGSKKISITLELESIILLEDDSPLIETLYYKEQQNTY